MSTEQAASTRYNEATRAEWRRERRARGECVDCRAPSPAWRCDACQPLVNEAVVKSKCATRARRRAVVDAVTSTARSTDGRVCAACRALVWSGGYRDACDRVVCFACHLPSSTREEREVTL